MMTGATRTENVTGVETDLGARIEVIVKGGVKVLGKIKEDRDRGQTTEKADIGPLERNPPLTEGINQEEIETEIVEEQKMIREERPQVLQAALLHLHPKIAQSKGERERSSNSARTNQMSKLISRNSFHIRFSTVEEPQLTKVTRI